MKGTTTTMKLYMTNRERGLTLTELLVVMLIIGLLATIAVPVYVARQEDARVRVAMGEARELAHAEEQVAIFHGFYVPLQVLDDLPRQRVFSTDNQDHIDLEGTNIRVIDPLTPARDQFNNQPNLGFGAATTPRAFNLINEWKGPFMNFHRYYTNNQNPSDPSYRTNGFLVRRDYPMDPWGNPYRFYSAEGIIGTSAQNNSADSFNSDSFSDGFLTNNDDRFDRYAIVSFGRDSLSDTEISNTLNPNDIYYVFGTDGVESNFGRIF